MGKDRVIKILANLIGKTAAHKILVKHTNKPDAINHMLSEIENYGAVLSDYVRKVNCTVYGADSCSQLSFSEHPENPKATQGFLDILEYNWNSEDKEKIKKESEKSLIKELKENHFLDVNFPSSEKSKILDETILNFLAMDSSGD